MKQIQWYPGHMAKAEREIEARLKLVDMVIELVDARAPYSSHNSSLDRILKNKPKLIIMTKQDLADSNMTNKWMEYYKEKGYQLLSFNLKQFKDDKKIVDACLSILKDKREKEAKKGLRPRPIRAMIIGIPNVGKSTLINALAKRKATVVGNKPGVTKAQQIIKINKDFELFDTPGILQPKFDKFEDAVSISLIGSIKRSILPIDDVFIYAIKYLNKYYPDILKERYQIKQIDEEDILPVYKQISDLRKLKLLRGDIDYERVHEIFFKDLSDGNLGKITWERVDEK